MAIPTTMVADRSGQPPCLPPSGCVRPRSASSSSTMDPSRPRSLPRFSRATPSASPSHLACRAALPPPSLSRARGQTAFQQLRIAAVKYDGQGNDSVIYPRFGACVRRFPVRWCTSPFHARSATVRPSLPPPPPGASPFKLMISNNVAGPRATDVLGRS